MTCPCQKAAMAMREAAANAAQAMADHVAQIAADNEASDNGSLLLARAHRHSAECYRVVADAIRSLPLPECDHGWHPIETAPHGALVLLAWRDTFLPAWSYEVGFASHGSRNEQTGISNRSWHGQATHWMPLPAAPEPPQGGEG